ncbi:Bug family tripartite tricarboxylate transporter substrate binding protein [Microbacterium rhizophilus]|uniref:Bug family tripartite tricarboxylate transporter substrate binding protein n=1 Tax=Microbacterium rhizophilus TaxID=3138934 RepID=UPI0031EEA322
MNKIIKGVGVVVAIAALAGCSSTSGDGAGGEASLEGETVTLVVGYDPGGGFDLYARMIAPELEKALDATVIVENRPGAGGLIATNEVWAAKPDGKTIMIVNTPGHLGSALVGADGVAYEAEGFGYIGQIVSEPNVVVTSATSGIATIDDAKGKRFAAGGPGSLEYVDALALNELLDLDSEVVTGFANSKEGTLAVIADNVELQSLSYGSQLSGIESGDTRPVLVVGESNGAPAIEGVPNLLDVVPEDKKDLAESHSALISSGRVLVTPPGIDPEMLDLLRTAFEEVATDEAFIKAAKDSGRDVVYRSGADVEKLVGEIMDSPAAYVDLLKKAYGL